MGQESAMTSWLDTKDYTPMGHEPWRWRQRYLFCPAVLQLPCGHISKALKLNNMHQLLRVGRTLNPFFHFTSMLTQIQLVATWSMLHTLKKERKWKNLWRVHIFFLLLLVMNTLRMTGKNILVVSISCLLLSYDAHSGTHPTHRLYSENIFIY